MNFDDVYVQCDVGNVVNVWFKGEIRENRHFTDHVQVAHDQKIWIIEKFEQKIDFGEKYMSYFAYACKTEGKIEFPA